MRPRLLFALLFLLGGVSCAPSAHGQAADAADALHRGRYDEARAAYAALLDAGETVHAPQYAEAFLAEGLYDDGLAAVDRRLADRPDDPYLRHARGRLLAAVGRYVDAGAAYAAAERPDFPANRLALAELYRTVGQPRQAVPLLVSVYRPYRDGTLRTAPALTVAARAAALLGEHHDANAAYRTAYALDATYAPALLGWADLFRTKYNDADAVRTYEELLALNPRHADALVGLAGTRAAYARQEELAQRALAVNPRNPDALALLGELRVLDGLYDEAEAVLERALAVHPKHEAALAHLAAARWLQDDADGYAALEARVREATARPSRFYRLVADDLTRRFRYPAAVEVAEQAVRAAPDDPEALAAFGTALLRRGDRQGARRYLQAAFERDPFNLFVGNTLTLLDGVDDFAVLEGPNVRILLPEAEAAVLGPEMLAEAEAAYAALAARYPYRPQGKILVEAYDEEGDFSVRVGGVPHLGLLGVAFGDVVALQTPAARSEAYSWARTLWHELAHTFAIGTSGYRVPRWLTEGLSVYEEARARPAWGRELDLAFFGALEAGRLLPIAEIDRGFTRPSFPGQVLLSYYHASRIIAYLDATYGFDAVVAILEGLREGMTVAAAIEAATGRDLASLDAAFRAWLEAERRRLAPVLAALPDAVAPEETPAPVLDRLAGPSDNTFFRALQEGRDALAQEAFGAAERHFRAALDQFDGFVGPGDPYRGLAAVYRARGDTAALQGILARLLARDEHAAAEARELGDLLAAAGRPDAAAARYAAALEVEPYDRAARATHADLLAAAGRHAEAAAAYRALLALDPVDRAGALYRLAGALHGAGRTDEAKRTVLQALEIAPGFRDAQRLLLRIVDGAS